MMQLTSKENFDFGSDEYRKLFRRARVSAFQYPEWLTAFYQNLIKAGSAEPLVVVGRSESTGELLAVIPLMRYTVNNNVNVEYAFAGVTDYAQPVVVSDLCSDPAHTSLFPERLVQALGPHDALRVQPVRAVDVTIWKTLLGTAPTTLGFGSHLVRPGTPFQQWRAVNLGRARRSQLDRKLRRLADKGCIELRLLNGNAAADALGWARHMRKDRFADDPIQRDDVLDFYRQVASKGATSGFARTYPLRCGDNPVAMCFGVVDGKRYCYLVLACDYGTFARFSPGMLILDLAMADWTAQGGTIFDFTIGDEPFKRVFRCERTSMYKFVRANTGPGTQ